MVEPGPRPIGPAELAEFLRERIPLSAAMAVEVRRAGAEGVELYAPLGPNRNHRNTGFGGSASALAILAAWSALKVRMSAAGLRGRIVIRRNTMNYDRPITAGFTATAAPPDADAWEKFAATLERGRTARVHVQARLWCEGEAVGELDGEFAVLPK